MTDNSGSIFNDADMDFEFDPNQFEDATGLSETLVGEDKKYKTIDELAKAVVFKEAHLTKIERENQLLRSKLTESDSVTKLLETLKANTQTNQSATNTNGQPNSGNEQVDDNKTRTVSPDDLVNQVLQKIESLNQKQTEDANLQRTKEVLVANYGPQFATKLKEWSEENSVPPQFLESLARTNPVGLFKILNVDPERKASVGGLFNSAPPSSTLNGDRINSGVNAGVRNNAYYEKLRAKDPKAFNSAHVQAQRMKDAIALGDRFFNNS